MPARAARETLFRTMAMENTEVRVLNYCPGPVDTNMQAEIRNCTKDPDVKKIFIGKWCDVGAQVGQCQQGFHQQTVLLTAWQE